MANHEFETSISGIPCICRVTYYAAATNRIITSQSLEPNDPEEFEYEILDRKGYAAPWLERKITDADDERIYCDFKESLNVDPY